MSKGPHLLEREEYLFSSFFVLFFQKWAKFFQSNLGFEKKENMKSLILDAETWESIFWITFMKTDEEKSF